MFRTFISLAFLVVLFLVSLPFSMATAEEGVWNFHPGSVMARGMAADSNGAIWISLDDGGVGKYVNGSLTVYPSSVTGGGAGQIVVDGKNRKWFAGVCYDDREWKKITDITGIHQMAVDNDGSVWMATSSGVVHVKIDLTRELFTGENTGLDFNSALLVTVDRDNVKWFYLDGRSGKLVATFDGVAWRVFSDPSCPVRIEDIRSLQASRYARALAFNNWVYDGHSWSDMGAYSYFCDHDGVFWSMHNNPGSVHGGIPASFTGIWRYDSKTKLGGWARNDSYWGTVYWPWVGSLCVDDANVKWFGLPGAGNASYNEQNKIITVISPKKGAFLASGGAGMLTWYAKNVDRVNIELSTDNGFSWKRIAGDVPASSRSYQWIAPDVNSESCSIRLLDASDQEVSGVSEGVFSIRPPFLRITVPNGGEEYRDGDLIPITWESVGSTRITIDVSLDAGLSWNNIATEIPAESGRYVWMAAGSSEGQCRVKITDTNNALLRDESDAGFTIRPFSPNALRFNQQAGVTIPNDPRLNCGTITLECWVRFEDIFHSGYEEPIGVFDQFLLYKEGNEGRLGFRLAHRRSRDGQSLYFSLYTPAWNAIDFTTTTGPINLDSSAWYHVAATFDGRVMTLYLNGEKVAETVVPIAYSLTINNDNNLLIGFPKGLNGYMNEVRYWNISRSQAQIRETMHREINDAQGLISSWHFNEPGGQSIIDSKTGFNGFLGTSTFTLTKDPERVEIPIPRTYVSIISPAGGESWGAEAIYPVKWEAQAVSAISLYYSLDGCITWNLIAENLPADSGRFLWTLPGLESPVCAVRACDSSTGQVLNTCRKFFPISTAFVQLLVPNGGERFRQKLNAEIQWEYKGIESVDIFWSSDNGVNWTSLANGVMASAKSYFWNVPEKASDRCIVRITDSANPSISDTSDSTFTIGEIPIRALSFSGHDVVTFPAVPLSSLKQLTVECWAKFTNKENVGAARPVWEWGGFTQHLFYQEEANTDAHPFELSYFADNVSGDTKQFLTFRFGRHSWNTHEARCETPSIPNGVWHHIAGVWSETELRLYLDGQLIAEQLAQYAVDAYPVVYIGKNFSGEIDEARIWGIARTQEQIQKTMFREVDRDDHLIAVWHLNGEDTLKVIDSAHGNNGYLGNSIESDVQDPSWVESNSPVATLKVLYPNGKEILSTKSDHMIRWDAYIVKKIDIAYSADSGGIWKSVAKNIDAAAGVYKWTPPKTPSSMCLIRISDSADSTFDDLSDNTFELSDILQVVTEEPLQFTLMPNNPNPFNNTTAISFILPYQGKTALTIYSIMGRKVRELALEQVSAGKRTFLWDGKDGSGRSVSSGVYFARLTMGKFSAVRKMLLMK